MAEISEFWASKPGRLPRTGNPDWLEVHRQRWDEAADRTDDQAARNVLAEIGDLPVVGAAFANSPFLSQCLISDVSFARKLFAGDADAVASAIMDETEDRSRLADESAADLTKRLRTAKRRIALTVALADIVGGWELTQVTGALADFAGASLGAACRHLLRRAHEAGDLSLPDPDDPETGSGLIVLGMGKLGARELNYSSDIDLIVLYDQDKVPYTGKHDAQHLFVRMARSLVGLMDERTKDGYVFRTDLRLRPDPGSTPPAISTLAAEMYYESAGQNWERAAMTKARPVAGDIEAGFAFLDILRPFMWRRSLDFAAIQDIQSIKRQINAHRGGGEVAVAGHNIKLGRGGIREIEFFAQTQQLIWGGREPDLRVRGTLDALARLVSAGHVAPEVAADLERSYGFHRRLEHRLQMVDDRQTHELPEDDEGLARIGAFMGFDSKDAFIAELLDRLRAVEGHYAALFEDEGDLAGGGNLVFTGGEDDPDTIKTLRKMGFSDPAAVSTTIRAWHTGRARAMRSARSRELLTELVPSILEAFAESPNPDSALMRFDEFLRGLPAGVQLFSLFTAHPGLFDLVAEIMGSAPRLADWLSRYPILLDGVLSRDFFDFLPDAHHMRESLADAMTQARDFQDCLDIQRRWANDRIFQIGVHMLRGRLSPVDASGPLSDVADSCLSALLPSIHAEFAEQHGRVPGGEMAVVAFGKLGSREMTVGSDLDLLFVYDVPDGVSESDGPRPLTPGQYYARLCQRFIGAITAPTGEGKLYEVDMRLRPAGNAGPIASSLQAFEQYYASDAWTWEHQALTRARVVCGEGDLVRRFSNSMRKILTRPRDPEKLKTDVSEMRGRMRREFSGSDPWDVKHMPGGLVDIEFIAQYLQLRHGADAPEIIAGATDAALAVARAKRYIDPVVADDLASAAELWRNLQGILRLTVGGKFGEASAPPALKAAIARACGMVDFGSLKERMRATAACTAQHFKTLLGEAQTGQGDR